jgi:hypothetical protein
VGVGGEYRGGDIGRVGCGSMEGRRRKGKR